MRKYCQRLVAATQIGTTGLTNAPPQATALGFVNAGLVDSDSDSDDGMPWPNVQTQNTAGQVTMTIEEEFNIYVFGVRLAHENALDANIIKFWEVRTFIILTFAFTLNLDYVLL